MNFNHKTYDLARDKNVKLLGRTLLDSGLHLSWSNSGVECICKGERIDFVFGNLEGGAPIYVKVFSEKGEQRFGLLGPSPRVILEFEETGEHIIKLLRVSESDIPLILKEITVFGDEADLSPVTEEKALKIEFIGDSIVAGWGVLAPAHRDEYRVFEQDSTKSFAYMTAEHLNAEIRTEAWSGQGVWRNCAGEEGVQFKDIFDMTLRGRKGYDHSQWVPDVFVVACGTNDCAGCTTDEEMIREGGILLDKIRKAYPKSKIVWTYGLMNGRLHGALERLIAMRKEQGDSAIWYLPLEKITAEKDEIGAVGHPNVNSSIAVSKQLSEFIKTLL